MNGKRSCSISLPRGLPVYFVSFPEPSPKDNEISRHFPTTSGYTKRGYKAHTEQRFGFIQKQHTVCRHSGDVYNGKGDRFSADLQCKVGQVE